MSTIGLVVYVVGLHTQNAELLIEKIYYLNKSIRAENDVKGLSYLLITSEIHLHTIDSILIKHPEIESYVEISYNSMDIERRQLLTITFEFTSDSLLDVITYYPLMPIPSNKLSLLEDTLKIER